jgi:hypothetical protein
MVAIKLYDIETGHVETLAELSNAEAARTWLEVFTASGIGANDVVYTDVARPPDRARPPTGVEDVFTRN